MDEFERMEASDLRKIRRELRDIRAQMRVEGYPLWHEYSGQGLDFRGRSVLPSDLEFFHNASVASVATATVCRTATHRVLTPEVRVLPAAHKQHKVFR